MARGVRSLALSQALSRRHAGSTLNLFGPRRISGADIAAAASAATGAPIRFERLGTAEANELLVATGELDGSEARLLVDLLAFQQASCDGRGNAADNAVEMITGRNATDVSAFFTEHAHAFVPGHPG